MTRPTRGKGSHCSSYPPVCFHWVLTIRSKNQYWYIHNLNCKVNLRLGIWNSIFLAYIFLISCFVSETVLNLIIQIPPLYNPPIIMQSWFTTEFSQEFSHIVHTHIVTVITSHNKRALCILIALPNPLLCNAHMYIHAYIQISSFEGHSSPTSSLGQLTKNTLRHTTPRRDDDDDTKQFALSLFKTEMHFTFCRARVHTRSKSYTQ